LDDAHEIIVEQSALPSSLTYIALGHIHRPHEVLLGAAHMRYAGSIERMDYGERDDPKSVVLLEIQGRRLCGPPQLLRLRCTTFYEVEIIDPDTQLPLLAQQYPDAQDALVRYVLHWDSLTHQRDRLCQQVEAIFPRWYDRTLKDKQTGIITEAGLEVQLTHDVVGTTRHYLHAQLEQHPLRQDLLALVEQLFVEEDEA
jgi:exonuclease SbcD